MTTKTKKLTKAQKRAAAMMVLFDRMRANLARFVGGAK